MKDLHIHTIYSDGELTPEEIINIVKEKEIDFFSITDHDTINGCKEIIENNLHKKNNLKFVTGIELSAKIDKGKCHILGYNIDLYSEYLIEHLKKLKEMDKYNILLITECLKNVFKLNFTQQDIDHLFIKKGSTNNVEISKMLVRLGYCDSINDAFKRYIIPSKKMTFDEKKEFSAYECIDIINKDRKSVV